LTQEREISIDMAKDEWSAMMNDAEAGRLSAAARAAAASAAPHPGGLGARWFTCSVAITRELLKWCEAAAERCQADDPEGAEILERAARNIVFALWRRGEGPPPDPIRYRR